MIRASIAVAALALVLLILSFTPLATDAPPGTGAPAGTPTDNVSGEVTLAAEGRALFMAKGCASCHRHADAGQQPGLIEVGPTLTNYEPDEAFVRAWLRDPQALRPSTLMPNLGLSDEEVDALIAFLAAE